MRTWPVGQCSMSVFESRVAMENQLNVFELVVARVSQTDRSLINLAEVHVRVDNLCIDGNLNHACKDAWIDGGWDLVRFLMIREGEDS